MKLVAIAVLGALLSAGCALQTGDPTEEETQRPGELVATPGGTSQTIRQLGANETGVELTPSNPAPGGPRATRGSSPTGPAGGGPGAPGGQKDNPNPSPWGDGVGGTGQVPAGSNGN